MTIEESLVEVFGMLDDDMRRRMVSDGLSPGEADILVDTYRKIAARRGDVEIPGADVYIGIHSLAVDWVSGTSVAVLEECYTAPPGTVSCASADMPRCVHCSTPMTWHLAGQRCPDPPVELLMGWKKLQRNRGDCNVWRMPDGTRVPRAEVDDLIEFLHENVDPDVGFDYGGVPGRFWCIVESRIFRTEDCLRRALILGVREVAK